MEHSGSIRKMESRQGEPVAYFLPLGEGRVDMNSLIGREIEMEFYGEINCVRCGRAIRKSFAQGYC